MSDLGSFRYMRQPDWGASEILIGWGIRSETDQPANPPMFWIAVRLLNHDRDSQPLEGKPTTQAMIALRKRMPWDRVGRAQNVIADVFPVGRIVELHAERFWPTIILQEKK